MNHKKSGFICQTHGGRVHQMFGGMTLMELLIVLAIIALLVGLLLPAVGAVRKAAREAKQRAQLTTIELAISAFKNDYGDYPTSSPEFRTGAGYVFDYCGSQKLSEALLGWDLMGFHPKSAWRADGYDATGTNLVYDSTLDANLRDRKGPYLELATANAFRLGDSSAGDGLFDNTDPLDPKPYVICDVFGVKKITLPTGKIVSAGMPILYYKADTSKKSINNTTGDFFNLIYNVLDNVELLSVKEREDKSKLGPTRIWNPLSDDTGNFRFFYGNPSVSPPLIGYIQDPKVTARPWPYRPDSYILISAGADGFYGTPDDICNFGY